MGCCGYNNISLKKSSRFPINDYDDSIPDENMGQIKTKNENNKNKDDNDGSNNAENSEEKYNDPTQSNLIIDIDPKKSKPKQIILRSSVIYDNEGIISS